MARQYVQNPFGPQFGGGYWVDVPDPEPVRTEDEKYESMLSEDRKHREEDLAEGRKRGEELFGEGTAMADVVARRKALLNGYTPEEIGSMRDQFTTQADTQLQTGLRALAGAAGRRGLRGAAAQGHMARLVMDSNRSNAQNEQSLFAKNIDAKRSALNEYEGSVGRVTAGKMGTEFGYGSLGAGERASAVTRILGDKQADATVAAANSGSKK